MYKDSAQRQEMLLDEATGLFGMIEEVKMKCLLLENKARQECQTQGLCWETDHASEELSEEVFDKVTKMHIDLDRYSHRLTEISEELKEINGPISKMDGTSGE